MRNNKKPLVFGYHLFYKVTFIIPVLIVGGILYVFSRGALDVCSADGCIIWGFFWNTIAMYIILILFLDFFAYTIFSTFTITSSGLIYKSGGLILRWLLKSKKFNEQDYNFYIYYWDYRILNYPDIYLLVTDKGGKVCFRLDETYPKFKELIEGIRSFCPRYKSIGVKGFLQHIFLMFRLKI